MTLLKAAKAYLVSGFCVIATNKDKRAFLPWTEYTKTRITEQQVEEQFNHPMAETISIICGESSGGLEVIDIDAKYDLTGELYEKYLSSIKEALPDLSEKLYLVATKGGGFHLYYRCSYIEGNKKLANRHTTEAERKANPKDKIRVLIETRGQGGYVLAPPSFGYNEISGSWKNVPLITPDQRETILDLARSFNEVIVAPQATHVTNSYNPKEFGMSPFDSYNKNADVLKLLTDNGWKFVKENSERWFVRRPGKKEGTSGDIRKDNKWFSVFSTSTEFETNKAYLPYAVFAQLECNGDFKKAAKKLLEMGYGEKREFFGNKIEKELFKKKKEGGKKEDLVKILINNHNKDEKDAINTVDQLEKMWGEALCVFWDVDDNGKMTISQNRFVEFLYYNGGFSLYYYDKNSTIFRVVRQSDGFVEESSTEHMKKFIKDYIETLPDTFDGGIIPEDLKELMVRGSSTYFSTALMEFLNRSSFTFLKDTRNDSYLPFNNGVVHITRDGIELLSYKQVNKVIWKSQVIDFDILIEENPDHTLVEYSKFLNCISGERAGQYEYALTLIGYLLHQFKDPTKPYAVILAEENEDENEGGGTGKGLFVKAISKLVQVESIDGKNFKLDKSFAFQRVGLDTNIISIEDVRKNIDFEGFYSIITEGVTVEKKNKDELFIPYSDSPKIVFTTNYTVPSIGNHGKRRQRVFEFSNFFSRSRTPEDFFKHKLFDDWDRDEWNRFYNLMFFCIQLYLEQGVLSTESSISIKRKQIRTSFMEEFLEWFDNHLERYDNVFASITEMYHDFLKVNEMTGKDYSIHRFKRAIKTTCDVFEFKVTERRNKVAENRKEINIWNHKGIKLKAEEEDAPSPVNQTGTYKKDDKSPF